MMAAALMVFATGCAFLMGYSVNQGSTCAVTAAKQIVDQNQATMLTGFAVAIGTAGLICLPLSWLGGGIAHVASDAPLSIALATGAILLGIGAFINDACIFGTLSRIGHGEVRFLGLPIGLALGFTLADRQSLIAHAAPTQNPFGAFSATGLIVVLGFACLLGIAWHLLRRPSEAVAAGEWPLRRAMVVLGACGGLLYSLTPGWTYADAVRTLVATGDMSPTIGFGALIAAISALAGALASGIHAKAFRFQPPTILTIGRSIVGGAFMAFGGTLIPGGNDALLLSSVPSATLSGMTAYAIMSITVPVLLLLKRRLAA